MKSIFTTTTFFFLFLSIAIAQKLQHVVFSPDFPMLDSLPNWSGAGGQSAAASAANCNGIEDVFCGSKKNGTTIGAGNDFTTSDYGISDPDMSGPDKLYRLTIATKTAVHVVLRVTSPNVDLDLFLIKSCDLPVQLQAGSVEYNPGQTIPLEVVDVNLDPGIYYIVVDGKRNVDNSLQQGAFSIEVNCDCSSIEENVLVPPSGNQLWCDNFDLYVPNKVLDPQSSRWQTWSQNSTSNYPDTLIDGQVQASNGNQFARFRYVSSTKYSDVVYWLSSGNVAPNNITSGRYRMSWRMQIPTGKKGYFNVLHTRPSSAGSNANWAYDIYFNRNTNGTGEIVLGNSTATFSTFTHPTSGWFNVVNIIDLNKDSAELWINNQFIKSWKFSVGTSTLNQLAGLNFYTENSNYDFNIDDLCIWQKPATTNCNNLANTYDQCVRNQKRYKSVEAATCDLYSSLEFEDCQNICDYGGTFIHRGEPRNGNFSFSDLAPGQLRNLACVKNAYNQNVPQELYADIYIFYENNPSAAFLQWATNDPNTRCFVMQCNFNWVGPQSNNEKPSGSAATCISGVNCFCSFPPFSSSPFYDPNNTGSCNFRYSNCDNFFYIVVTGTLGESYSNLAVVPGGACPQNITELPCGSQDVAGEVVYQGLYSDQLFANVGWPGVETYSCYNGNRSYTGGEAFYKIDIDRPKKVNFSLQTFGSEMGLFLYQFICGKQCIAYSGTVNDFATLSATLQTGIYYLVVDLNSGFNENFELSLDCENTSFIDPFYDNNYAIIDTDCPADLSQGHQIQIPNSVASTPLARFDYGDFLVFRFPGAGGKPKDVSDMTFKWDEPPGFSNFENAYADFGNDTFDCGFANGEEILVRRVKLNTNGSGYNTDYTATWAPAGSNGNTAGKFFTYQNGMGGISEVSKLTPIGGVTSFNASTTEILFVNQIDTFDIQISSSKYWTAQIPSNATWLDASPKAQVNGPQNLKIFTKTVNTSECPRESWVSLKPNGVEYKLNIRVEQSGVCLAPNVSLSSNAPSNTVCKGDSATLTVVPANCRPDQFKYLWSNGRTTQSIRVAPQNQTTYSVTVTNPNNCDRNTTSSLTIFVKNKPVGTTNSTAINCTNPTAQLTATSNLPNSTFVWSGPGGFSKTGATVSTTLGGIYTVTMTANGCSSTATATVSQNTTQPTATASTDGNLTCTDLQVQISATTNATNPKFQWSSPNGFSSSSASASVSTAGIYTVTVTDQTNGCTRSASVTVGGDTAAPQLTTSGATLNCNSSSVQIFASSPNVPNATFSWTDPNGNFFSNQASPNVSVAGIYTVVATNPANNCTASATAQVLSNSDLPNVSASVSNILNCKNPSVNLVGNSTSGGVSFSWTTAAGGFVSDQKTVSISTAGFYIFKVTFNGTGCSDQRMVEVKSDFAQPGASATGGSINCRQPEVQLLGNSNTAGVIWEWTFPNNSKSNLQNPTVSSGGNYLLVVTNPANGCTSSITATVVEDKNAPTASIAPPEILTCSKTSVQLNATASSGTDFTYLWTASNGGNISAGATTLQPTIDKPGDYQLVVTNQTNGCTTSATTTVAGSTDLPMVNAGQSVALTCKNPTAQLSGMASTGANYQISWSGSGIVSGGQTLSPTVDKPGVYTLTVKNLVNLCQSSSSVTVTDGMAKPEITIAAPAKITCANNKTIQLTGSFTPAGATATLNWYSPSGSAIGQGLKITVGEAGIYTLSVLLETTGCAAAKEINIGIDTTSPSGSAGVDKTICSGDSWVLGQGNSPNFQYQWSPANQLSDPNAPSPSVQLTSNQTYFVTITNPTNECTRSDAAVLKISPALNLQIAAVGQLKCHGDSNGKLLATGSGGTAPLTYQWSNGSTGQQINNLAAGNYTATVKDNAGCTKTENFQLDQPDPIVGNETIGQTGAGLNEGFISISASGGAGNYTYQWYLNGNLINGQTNPLLANLPAMSGYSVVVTDALNCSKTFGPFKVTTDANEPEWAADGIRVFPNPTTGRLNIAFDLPAPAQNLQVEITDLLGRTVATRQSQNQQRSQWTFDLLQQASGLYFLKIKIDGAVLVRSVSVIR